MGKINQGILGGFSGKVGSVIGSIRQGINIMRAKSNSPHKTRTLAQLQQLASVKTEYRDNYVRDSIYRYDSIYVKEKGDTLILERYRYLYRDKWIRDSVFICDTIRVPFPVEIVKQVKKPLTSWQNFQVWCGRISLSAVLGIIAYFVLRKLRIKKLITNH